MIVCLVIASTEAGKVNCWMSLNLLNLLD